MISDKIERLINHYSLSFEERNSKEKKFSAITNQEKKSLKYLEDRCAICLEQFRSEDLVKILSCSHGYHASCFKNGSLKVCPLRDGGLPSSHLKSDFIGHSIVFSSKLIAIGRLIATYKKQINFKIKSLIITHQETIITNFLSETDQKNRKFLEKLAILFINDCLYNYEKYLETYNYSEHSFDAIFQAINQQFLEDKISMSELVEWIREDIDFEGILKNYIYDYYNINNYINASIKQILSIKECDDLFKNEEAFIFKNHLLVYCLEFFFDLSNRLIWKEFLEALEEKFYQSHLTKLQKFSTDQEITHYLNSLPHSTLYRLVKLDKIQQENDDFSIRVRKCIYGIDKNAFFKIIFNNSINILDKYLFSARELILAFIRRLIR